MYPIRPVAPAFPDFDRLFEDVFGRTHSLAGSEFAPALDVTEDDDGFHVRAEMPGVAPNEVEVSVEDGVLSIRGEKKFTETTKDGRLHRTERRYGKFVRTVQFPTAIDADRVTATHQHGVLAIHLPKHARAKARTVKIETAE